MCKYQQQWKKTTTNMVRERYTKIYEEHLLELVKK